MTENIITYAGKPYYEEHYPKIPIITIKQLKSMKKTAKKKAKYEVVKSYKTTTGSRWHIIKSGKAFRTLHVSRNGNPIGGNPKQFNSVKNALKNIEANASAQLIPVKGKKGINGYVQ